LSVALVFVAGMAVVVPTAKGDVPPAVQEHVDSVTQAVRSGTPVPQELCDEICERIRAAEQSTTRPKPTIQRRIWQQLRTLRARIGNIPKLRVLGPIGLGVTAGYAGWKIVGWTNAKFLRLGIPAATSEDTQRLMPSPAQSYYFPGVYTPDEQGWVWNYVKWGESNFAYNPNAENCPGYGPPSEFTLLPADPTFPPVCNQPGGGVAWAPEDALEAWGPAEDYTDQPYDYSSEAPPDPGFPSNRAGILDELGNPDYPDLNPWLDHHAGGTSEDPTAEYVSLPACSGLTFAPCAELYRDEGFTGTIEHAYASFDDADVSKAEGEVLEQNPDAGSRVDVTSTVTIKTNPVGSDMPAIVPEMEPAPGEPAEDYEQKVTDLGFSRVAIEDASDPNLDYEPDTAVDVSPDPGTRTRRDTEVTIYSNPRTDDEDDPRCDTSVPFDPGPGSNRFAEFDTFIGIDPRVIAPPGPINLHWGNLSWGYRHIAKEHGWDGNDRRDTQFAFDSVVPIPARYPGSYAFHYFYAKDTLPCTRRVVVQFEPGPDDAGRPKHIITSFAYEGWYVGG
jgi:PASTA domain